MSMIPTIPITYFGVNTAIEQAAVYDINSFQSPYVNLDPPNRIGAKTDRYVPVEDHLLLMIQKIFITALVFIAILAWFEFLRLFYDVVFSALSYQAYSGLIYKRLLYAIFITAIATIGVYIIYCYMLDAQC